MLVSRTLSCVDCAVFFFFNDTATTEIYTLSLHDALPISGPARGPRALAARAALRRPAPARRPGDRKSTRLNSSHSQISYAVFCLKKKKQFHSHGAHNHTPQRAPPPDTLTNRRRLELCPHT